MEKSLCGYFSSDSVELWDCDRIRDTSYHLEPVMHSDKESSVVTALGELDKCFNILRTSTNRLRCKSTKFVNIELTSTLCKAKIIVDAECARLYIKHLS